MSWLVWSVVSSLCAVTIETINRIGGHATFWHALVYTGPLIVLLQAGIFYSWRNAPSMMLAWVTFSACTLVFRLLSLYFIVGEPMNLSTSLGVVLVVAGVYLVKVGT